MEIRAFQAGDRAAVVDLWQRCQLVVAHNNPQRDIDRKLQKDGELFLVGVIAGEVVASVMAGYEGHRGWVNYLAVAPERQKQGLGRALMVEVEQLLLARGCPKINLQIRTSNRHVIEFYRALGFIEDKVVSLGKRLITDNE
ncbi:GNAT family acetyltransferase [Halioxenophilus sp. WMMB6]|uniref:GNAT family acetyltransferase n=1 Tax=Halioxenophilus sp. WMMB6 TaxID=3073815 RepID=UPI00295EA855|nr:GNAT family acetyltransferase [Halioxenophilus sp. WMMB6]